MDRDQIIKEDDDFFSPDLPCPERIPNCKQLREQYLKDVEVIKAILTDKFNYTLQEIDCCGDLKNVIIIKYLNLIANTLTDYKYNYQTSFSDDKSSYLYGDR